MKTAATSKGHRRVYAMKVTLNAMRYKRFLTVKLYLHILFQPLDYAVDGRFTHAILLR